MSELKRYEVITFDNYEQRENGFWVKFQDVQKLQSQLSESQEKYNEIIMEVVNKVPNMTRHERAIEIIRAQENQNNSAQCELNRSE